MQTAHVWERQLALCTAMHAVHTWSFLQIVHAARDGLHHVVEPRLSGHFGGSRGI